MLSVRAPIAAPAKETKNKQRKSQAVADKPLSKDTNQAAKKDEKNTKRRDKQPRAQAESAGKSAETAARAGKRTKTTPAADSLAPAVTGLGKKAEEPRPAKKAEEARAARPYSARGPAVSPPRASARGTAVSPLRAPARSPALTPEIIRQQAVPLAPTKRPSRFGPVPPVSPAAVSPTSQAITPAVNVQRDPISAASGSGEGRSQTRPLYEALRNSRQLTEELALPSNGPPHVQASEICHALQRASELLQNVAGHPAYCDPSLTAVLKRELLGASGLLGGRFYDFFDLLTARVRESRLPQEQLFAVFESKLSEFINATRADLETLLDGKIANLTGPVVVDLSKLRLILADPNCVVNSAPVGRRV